MKKKLDEKYSIKPIVEFDIVEDEAMDLVLGGAGGLCTTHELTCLTKDCPCYGGFTCLYKFCACDTAICNFYSPCLKNIN